VHNIKELKKTGEGLRITARSLGRLPEVIEDIKNPEKFTAVQLSRNNAKEEGTIQSF